MAKIGSPLYILREDCKKDLFAVLDKIANLGYDGVEFLGMFENKPSAIRKRLDLCGLRAVGDHVPFDEFKTNTQKVIDEHKEIGCGYITISAPPKDGLPGGENYKQTIETYEKIGELTNKSGMKLLFHNHAEELKSKVNNKEILENILDDVKSDLLYFEPDLGWIQIGGGDPEYYLKKYINRCPVIHFKDYMPIKSETDGEFVFRPVGYGVMKNVLLYSESLNCNPAVDWYVMDHDCAYDRDSYKDLKICFDYFKNLIRVNK